MPNRDPKKSELRPVRGLTCSRCESQVGRLPSNGISPLPSYRCLECGTTLTTGSARLLHAVAGLLAVALFAGGSLVLLEEQADGRAWGFVKIALVALIVEGYCVYAMLQPAVRRRGEAEEE